MFRVLALFAAAVSAMAGLSAYSGAAVAGEREPELLQRSGKWLVRYDENACQLFAEFGKGKNNVVLRIVNNGPGEWFQLSLFGTRLRASTDRVSAKVDFGLSKPFPATAYFVTSGKTPGAIFSSMRLDGWESSKFGEVPPVLPASAEAQVTALTVHVEGKPPFRLATGPLDKQFTLMRNCIDGLMQSWGYDPVVQDKLLRRPSPITSPATWLKSDDYPGAALAQGHNGMVEFRLAIDAEGKVEDCHIVSATEPSDFSTVTCSALKRRARLQPALDAQGMPVRSFFISHVNWQARP